MIDASDTAYVAGALSGRIMSILRGTQLYKETAVIPSIDFEEVAETVRVKKVGARTEVALEIKDTVFRMYYRKGYLFYERESWKIDSLDDVRRMLRHFQDIVHHFFVLEAAAGVI